LAGLDAVLVIRVALLALGGSAFALIIWRHVSGATGRMVKSLEVAYGVQSRAAETGRQFQLRERLVVCGSKIVAGGCLALMLAAFLDLPDWLKWASAGSIAVGGALAVMMLVALSATFMRLDTLIGHQALRDLLAGRNATAKGRLDRPDQR
jgi:hypothetical protein